MEKKNIIAVVVIIIVIILAITLSNSVYLGPSSSQCSDQRDNDGDGFCDYKSKRAKCVDGSTLGDSGCSSRSDNNENNCGDLICGSGETCSTCTIDCGQCDSCSDSDGGFALNVKGTVSGISGGTSYSNTDTCDGVVLLEWYCGGNKAYSSPWNCVGNTTTNCVDGACV